MHEYKWHYIAPCTYTLYKHNHRSRSVSFNEQFNVVAETVLIRMPNDYSSFIFGARIFCLLFPQTVCLSWLSLLLLRFASGGKLLSLHQFFGCAIHYAFQWCEQPKIYLFVFKLKRLHHIRCHQKCVCVCVYVMELPRSWCILFSFFLHFVINVTLWMPKRCVTIVFGDNLFFT